MPSLTLREILQTRLVVDLVNNSTHERIPEWCRKLGLPDAPPEGSKREKFEACVNAVPDQDLPRLAESYLKELPMVAERRNELQDLIWADGGFPEIPKRIRRELARSLTASLYQDSGEFMALLNRLWILDDDPFSFLDSSGRNSLRRKIEQHVVRNPDDWDAEILFDELGAFTASDRRFSLFLEGLASAEVLPDEPAQRAFAETANQSLRRCGVELRETGSSGGYPVFQLVRISGGPARRPKNLIFASPEKPDLRLTNAIENDVEVVSNADRVLIYERPIGDDGLTWHDLQTWWSETHGIVDANEAKKSLYLRLKESLPAASPPQKRFFEAYHRRFGREIPRLPALLPEVWLHWDPKTVLQRGADALLRFRMDFLLLLPNRVRVVVEIDGKHHYGDEEGRARPDRYAEMTLADRELRLAGYEVYRFGAVELSNDSSTQAAASEFFETLFERHKIRFSGPTASR